MEPCARWGELGQAGCNTTTDREGRPQCGITTNGLNKWYSFPLTSLAQGWVDGSLANAGVLLRDAYAHSACSTWPARSTATATITRSWW